jgi:hypothetical protein
MISVSIYEDNEKLRDVLEMLISTTDGFKVLGTYADCQNVRAEIKVQRHRGRKAYQGDRRHRESDHAHRL